MGFWYFQVLFQESKEIGWLFTMEDSARSGLREFNLASRKAEEAGQSFSQFSFKFLCICLVAEKKEKEKKVEELERKWWKVWIFLVSGCFSKAKFRFLVFWVIVLAYYCCYLYIFVISCIFLEAKHGNICVNDPFSYANFCSLETIPSSQLAWEFGGSAGHIEAAIREGVHFLLEKWSGLMQCHQQD